MYSNLFVVLNSKALALLQEFAETQDDIIDIDEAILYRCRKKHFPMIFPRLADMGCLISEIDTIDTSDDYMNVRLYSIYDN